MVQSGEYVLVRLDRWYADRYRKNYTDEIGKDIARQISDSLHERGDLNLSLELIMSDTMRKFSKEEQIKQAQTYFTDAYAELEGVIGGLPLGGGRTIDEIIPRGYKEEYIGPLFEQFKKIQQFVERVRGIAGQDLSREVTDRDIDLAFLDAFGNHEGFTEYFIAYINGLSQFLDLAVRMGGITKEAFDDAIMWFEVTKDKLFYIHEKVFGDLKK